MIMNRKWIFIMAAVTPLLAGGCTTVKPWERGTLADYTMHADRDPLSNAR